MKPFYHILSFLMLIALLSAGACKRLPGEGSEEYGTLALQVGIGEAETKADATPDPRDGDVFHNILVVVSEKDGTVIDHVFKEYPCTGDDVPQNQEPKDVESTSSDWIYFVGLKVGYYQVYAYANIDAVAWQKEDVSALVNVNEIAAKIYEGNGFPDRQFAHFETESTDSPAYPDEGEYMLLTGHDELYVGVDPYIGRIDLYRPVVKFEVVLDNHTPFHLQLTDLHFNKFNASDGYLIGHMDENGNPVIPDGNAYRALPAFTGPANVAPQAQATVYSKLLYENRLGQDYRMFATVQFASSAGTIINDESGNPLVDPDDASKPLSKILTSSSVRRVPYEDIRDLPRGGSMNVLVVTPNTGNGGFLGYFTPESRLAFDQATYNFEESFRSKAEAMLNNQTIGSYYQLTLSKESGADKYHLYKDDVDLFAKPRITDGSNINGLYLKEGTYLKANGTPLDYPISSEFAGSLCRFTQTEADNARSLLYNNLTLKLDGNAYYGNRMWVFYEIYPVGTVLKLIDRESSRVSTLTQMVRGQKLTAVMNVYYKSETGEFTFSLDNTYWDNGHNPSHMFE